jgi:predicted RNase H-like nuclease
MKVVFKKCVVCSKSYTVKFLKNIKKKKINNDDIIIILILTVLLAL